MRTLDRSIYGERSTKELKGKIVGSRRKYDISLEEMLAEAFHDGYRYFVYNKGCLGYDYIYCSTFEDLLYQFYNTTSNRWDVVKDLDIFEEDLRDENIPF